MDTQKAKEKKRKKETGNHLTLMQAKDHYISYRYSLSDPTPSILNEML